MRRFRQFSWKDTNLRVSSDRFDTIVQHIMAQRKELERYIREHAAFKTALSPLPLLDGAPEIARRMAAAAALTGLGPMASVAGTLAQLGAEAAMADGCTEAIVENGGDMFVYSLEPVTIGIYAGENALGAKLAFQLEPKELPLALCSSSSHMGHSLSFGQCDLATVIAKEAPLADSAATLTCNNILKDNELESTLHTTGSIPGVLGILAVKEGKIGIWGDLPKLVRNADQDTQGKITRDKHSPFAPSTSSHC